MDAITGLVAAKGIQEVGNAVAKVAEGGGSDGFDAILKGILQIDGQNNVNEEELFAGLIKERLMTTKGEEAAAQYQELLAAEKDKIRQPDGYVSTEKAAKNALAALVTEEVLTEEEAQSIHAEAFEAAQLDDDTERLFDSFGSAEDPTVAVMELQTALERARLQIEAFDSGEKEANIEAYGLKASGSGEVLEPNGMDIDGAGAGFLWKPESDHSGNLVVVLPSDLAGQVEGVVLKDSSGAELERGVSSGMGNPDALGEREHFRFEQAGGDYPADVVLEVLLTDGSTRSYRIPDPSQRYD